MQRAFALELKSITEAGEFEGYASTYGGEPDSYNDIVDVGAFTRTIAASKERPLLLEHRDAIGTVQLTDSPTGLIAKGKLSLGLEKARDAYIMLRDGIARSLSVGYETVKSAYTGDIRHLQEIKLWEVSIVVFPANPAAVITGIKSDTEAKRRLLLHQKALAEVLSELKGTQWAK